jgi:hypothetical protein
MTLSSLFHPGYQGRILICPSKSTGSSEKILYRQGTCVKTPRPGSRVDFYPDQRANRAGAGWADEIARVYHHIIRWDLDAMMAAECDGSGASTTIHSACSSVL